MQTIVNLENTRKLKRIIAGDVRKSERINIEDIPLIILRRNQEGSVGQVFIMTLNITQKYFLSLIR